jgi:hypothetical protein
MPAAGTSRKGDYEEKISMELPREIGISRGSWKGSQTLGYYTTCPEEQIKKRNRRLVRVVLVC